MAKLMEYNFNSWTIPTPPVTPATPDPPYYPDLSGNAYHLNDNRGNSMAAGDGPAGDAAGNCIDATNLNTYFGANSSINDSNFDWNTGGTFSVFWCMRIMEIPPVTGGFFPVVTNYANTYPFWNVYVDFSGAHNEDSAKIILVYEEVGPTGVTLRLASQRLSVDYLWHTFAITVDRDNGTAEFYWDAVEQNERTWDTAVNIDVVSQQHEIVYFGTNLRPDFGHLTDNPPARLRFDGTEFYDNILSLGDIQTLHAKYT